VHLLPIATDALPSAMLTGTQALVVRDDLSYLKQRLREVDLESIILPLRPRPPFLHWIADLPESRTATLVAQGTSLVASVASGRIRQRLFSLLSPFPTNLPQQRSGSTWIASNQEAISTVGFFARSDSFSKAKPKSMAARSLSRR